MWQTHLPGFALTIQSPQAAHKFGSCFQLTVWKNGVGSGWVGKPFQPNNLVDCSLQHGEKRMRFVCQCTCHPIVFLAPSCFGDPTFFAWTVFSFWFWRWSRRSKFFNCVLFCQYVVLRTWVLINSFPLCYGALVRGAVNWPVIISRNSLWKMMALLCKVCWFCCAGFFCTKRAPRLRNVFAFFLASLSTRSPCVGVFALLVCCATANPLNKPSLNPNASALKPVSVAVMCFSSWPKPRFESWSLFEPFYFYEESHINICCVCNMSYQGVGGWDLNFYEETKIPTLSFSHPVSSGLSDLFFFGPFDHTFLPRVGKPFQPNNLVSCSPQHGEKRMRCPSDATSFVFQCTCHPMAFLAPSCFGDPTFLRERFFLFGFGVEVDVRSFSTASFFVNTWFYVRGCWSTASLYVMGLWCVALSTDL